MSGSILEEIEPAIGWIEAGHAIAIAIVTRTWGSAPRPAGSMMVVRDDGAFLGSVSGGCVEGAVISEAQAAIADGKIRNLHFGVTNEEAWTVGLACGGTVEIHVSPVCTEAQRDILKNMQHARDENRAAVLASDLSSLQWRLIDPAEEKSGTQETDALAGAAIKAARHDRSGQIEAEGKDWFLTVLNPPLDFVVIGAVHIAQPLIEMAKLAGYAVRVVDPRTHFASRERFPGVALVHQWPDAALAESPPGRRSALIALTHDPKLDDPALAAGLRSPAFYIGALGSRQSHAKRLERLAALGFSQDDLNRIHGPIGLAIGARSPAEIAVSIMAEITQTLHTD